MIFILSIPIKVRVEPLGSYNKMIGISLKTT